jgi:hypothetical protein
MDKIIDEPNPALEFSINTNGGVSDSRIRKYVEKAKQIEKLIRLNRVYTSVDTHGAQAEYIRHGLDYDKWLTNIDYMMTELPHTKFTIMCTANIFSVTNFKRLLEDVYDLKIKHFNKHRKVAITLDTSILRWPGHQRANILPPEYADMMQPALDYMRAHEEGSEEHGIPHYQGFFDFEIAKLERFIEFIKAPKHETEYYDLDTTRKDFVKFVDEHDRRRGTDFKATFPELLDFYNMCKELDND